MNRIKSVLLILLLAIGFNGLAQDPHAESGLKKGIVQEVLQVSSYTYLNLLEDGAKKWVAAPRMEAKLGETYYYKDGMEMRNFESKELERKFDTIFFLRYITRSDLIDSEKVMDKEKAVIQEVKPAKQPTLDRLDLNIEALDGGMRIAELFENKSDYHGKKIRIKGEVTKFSAAIMGKNWIHFQDGTEYEGEYDLMITSQEQLNVGDVVVLEGVITLDRDFGSGYFYEVIMEEAVIVK